MTEAGWRNVAAGRGDISGSGPQPTGRADDGAGGRGRLLLATGVAGVVVARRRRIDVVA
ncbi:hypothetical protein ACPFP2_28950 [Micromonospora citrea]|uniref:hypothetical protein n=1 Tax=Micromonospora citrea TaxID=47855 RepID=UPI003C4A8531